MHAKFRIYYHSLYCLEDGSASSVNNKESTSLSSSSINDLKNEDGYESISDEELDMFDDSDDLKLPKPASVMEVDWSMLSKMNKPLKSKGNALLYYSLPKRSEK